MGVTGRLRGAVFAPYADDPRAPACRWGTRGDQRKPPIRRRPSAGGGYERSPSIRATLGAWWRRRRISPFTSCRRCRCGSWRCRSACATSYTAMPIFRAPPCGCSCAWWSNTCVRTVRVRAPRPASARWPSFTASARRSMPTSIFTASSSTACSTPTPRAGSSSLPPPRIHHYRYFGVLARPAAHRKFPRRLRRAADGRSRQFKPMSENDPNPPVAVFLSCGRVSRHSRPPRLTLWSQWRSVLFAAPYRPRGGQGAYSVPVFRGLAAARRRGVVVTIRPTPCREETAVARTWRTNDA